MQLNGQLTAGEMIVNSGTLQIGANDVISAGQFLADGGTIESVGGAARSISNDFEVYNNVEIAGSLDLQFTGIVSGTGSLNKTSSAQLALQGTNTFSGGITTSGGTIAILNNAALGTGTLTTTAATGLRILDQDRTLANDLVIGGDLTIFGGQALTIGGNTTFNVSADVNATEGNLTFAGNVTLPALGAGVITGSNNVTFDGNVDGFGFDIDANGSVVFQGSVGGASPLDLADITAGSLQILANFDVEALGLVTQIVDGISISGAVSAGAGAPVVLATERQADILNGGSITATSGDISISANQQATATTGDFVGITVSGSIVTQTGNILLMGRGGDTNEDHGIYLPGSGLVSSTGAAGSITLDGTGSATNAGGIRISGGAITSVDAPIDITAFGGLEHGFALFGGSIEATGSAAITIDSETAGASSKVGLYVDPGTIRTHDGNLSITVVSNGLAGLLLNDSATLESLGSGSIDVLATNSLGLGITINESATITSLDGNISLSGTGGTGAGVELRASSLVSSTGTATITVAGQSTSGSTGITLSGNAGNRISSVSGDVNLTAPTDAISVGAEMEGTGALADLGYRQ